MPTEISGSTGVNKITDGTVVTADIAADAITDAKIATGITASKLTGALPAISGANLTNIDGGKVAQVVEGRRTGVATYAVSQTWTAIGSGNNGLNLDITPSATSSKILLTAHVNLAAHSGQRGGISFFRDSTQIGLGDANGNRRKSHMHYTGKIDDTTSQEGLAISFLDSPNSTSSITYTLRFWHENTTNVVINQAYSSSNDSTHMTGVSSITAMEILA